MTPRQSSVRARVDAARTSVHRDLFIALGGIAGAVIPIVLLIGWALAGVTGWGAPSAAPLLIELAAIAAVVGLVRFGMRRWLGRATHAHIASAAENELGLPEGSVRGILEVAETAPNGTSAALARYAEASIFPHVSDADLNRIAGAVGRSARRRRSQATVAFAALSVAVIAAAFAAPARSRAGWSPLLNPVSHLTPPALPPLAIEPGNVEVPRGSTLDVRVHAPGRSAVLLQWRAEGDLLHSEPVPVGNGDGSAQIAGIDAPVKYWVRAPDGAISDTFRITPVDPLMVSDLTVDIVYPAYLGRPADRFEGELPNLEVPEGTQFIIRGRATRALRTAVLARDSAQLRFNVEDAQFSGRWVPTVSGSYTWSFVGASGAPAELAPAPFDLTVVPDAPPSVAITFPGADTVLGPELMQSIVADASDDHGIVTATLVSWKTSALGVREMDVEVPVTLEGETNHAIVRGMLDARVRNLMPGDTLSYYIRITDNSPRRQTAVSETYTLRLPSVEELRDNSAQETSKLLDQMGELARQAEELEKLTRDMNRRAASEARRNAAQSGRGNGSSGGKQMDFEQAQQARDVLERQEKVAEQAAQMSKQLEAIQRAMEAAGLQDPELQQRIEELRELYRQLVTPEMQRQMEQLRQALEKLDPEEVRRQMEELAKQQEQFREQIERSIEMMRRAAAEQELNSLTQQAKELATQQQALSEEMKRGGEAAQNQAEKQKEIEQKTNKLADALAELQKRLGQQGMTGPAQKTGKAGEQAKDAGKDMGRAAEQAGKQQGQQAAQSGKQAAEKLNETAKSLEQTRQEMADGRNQETQEAMDQATSDALSLAQKQNELLQRMQNQMNKQGGEGQEQSPEGQKLPNPNDLKPNLPRPNLGAQQQGDKQQGDKQQGQQQSGQQQGGKQQSGQQQGGQQQGSKQPGGQQQGGQQQGGQQQGGQQSKQGGKQEGGQGGNQQGGRQKQGQGGQQAGGQQNGQPQPGQQQGGQQQGGQQQGGQQQGGQQQGGQQQGGQQQGGQQPGDEASIRAEQQALKQGLEQLGKNLSELNEQAGSMNRDVGSALGRANLSMEQTLKALEEGRMPVQEAQKTLEDLNRLALALLNNQQQGQGQGSGLDETMKQLQDLAKQQGSLNGQASSLAPLNLGQQAMSDQMNRLSREQREIAQKLGGMNNIGGREDVLGQLDQLAKEAEALARELAGGRLTPQTMARQERLFHKLLDAGRTLEREEYSDERKAERPGSVGPSQAGALRAELLDSSERFPTPTAEQLKNFSPAMRRLILEYYDRLNRAAAAATQGKEKGGR